MVQLIKSLMSGWEMSGDQVIGDDDGQESQRGGWFEDDRLGSQRGGWRDDSFSMQTYFLYTIPNLI